MCNAFRCFLLLLWWLFFSSLFFSFICQYIDARPLLCQTRLGIVRSESVVEVMWITGCMIRTEKNKTRRKTKKWSVSLRGQNYWAGDSAVWHHAAMFIYREIILKLFICPILFHQGWFTILHDACSGTQGQSNMISPLIYNYFKPVLELSDVTRQHRFYCSNRKHKGHKQLTDKNDCFCNNWRL